MRRISIRSLMGLVVLIAIDCAAIRAYNSHFHRWPDMADLALFGLLPMANILALGLLKLLADPGAASRPCLIGFQVSGWGACLLTLAIELIATDAILEGIKDAIRLLRFSTPLFLLAASAILLAPQLTVAALGGRLLGRRVSRTRPATAVT